MLYKDLECWPSQLGSTESNANRVTVAEWLSQRTSSYVSVCCVDSSPWQSLLTIKLDRLTQDPPEPTSLIIINNFIMVVHWVPIQLNITVKIGDALKVAVLKRCMTIITKTIGWVLAKYGGMTPSVHLAICPRNFSKCI